MTLTLEDRAAGALVGAAVGDALGGPVEGWSPEQIVERHGGRVRGIVGPWYADWRTARPIAPYHKGDGHVTDDTLMTHALVRVYEAVRDHLDAYAVAEHLVPDLMTTPRWIPELEAEALVLQRVFLAEKWIVTRIHYGHADPREAGEGNIVNCGAAMYMAPVGIVNAGHPAGAYAEALDVAGAHQSSYGREAAGVFAAAVAAACVPGATAASVVDTALGLAKDGTRQAIAAVREAARGHRHFESALGPLRAAVAPYDSVGPDYRAPSLGARRPSRLHSIEELPIALGMLLIADGGYEGSVLGAVNYGRDCDSIAGMAGALAGALGGEAAVPAGWAKQVADASRLDLHAPAAALASVAREVFARDLHRRRTHESAFTTLTPPDAP
ncbi:ADP-ribosylglycohydrolase family protein [Streptomyces sp. NPDC091268]|uniref:ADP-ribosylglycohydrolase family protein n=1 Tax=Streptomyces sp. NPDC091268 TaxID=3365979 RepID=UPI00380C0706